MGWAFVRRGMLRIWDTDVNTANALAVGVFPGCRYILVSDLLLLAARPHQSEAVVAHEAAHIHYRHLGWFILFFIAIAIFIVGPLDRMLIAIQPESGFARLARVDARDCDPRRGAAGLRVAESIDRAAGRRVRGAADGRSPVGSTRDTSTRARRAARRDRLRRCIAGGHADQWRRRSDRRRRGTGAEPDPKHAARNLIDRFHGVVQYGLSHASYFLHGSYDRRTAYLAELATDPRRTAAFERRVLMWSSSPSSSVGLASAMTLVG